MRDKDKERHRSVREWRTLVRHVINEITWARTEGTKNAEGRLAMRMPENTLEHQFLSWLFPRKCAL
jgi:hypothetical protein